ncbi:MAG: hypothetical protein LDL06_04350, partial [Candidatus Nitrosotenuis sp.]|nr:hypothetical protein [Candidatus Nitrosotenuis sp.]
DSSPGGGLLGISDALRNIGGITQQYAAALINNGRATSTKSVSGTSKAQSGGFGGYKGTRFSNLFQALTFAYGPYSGYASNLTPQKILGMMDFIESEGVPLPTLSPLAGTFNTKHSETIRAFEAALAEANRRRSTRIERQTTAANAAGISLSQYQSLSQTTQGQIDIAGMTFYRQLATIGG